MKYVVAKDACGDGIIARKAKEIPIRLLQNNTAKMRRMIWQHYIDKNERRAG